MFESRCNRPFGRVALFLLLTSLTIGCGSSAPKGPELAPAKGKVTLNGNSLSGAKIFFHPQDPKQVDGVAVADEAGAFEIFSLGQSGAVPGKYKVTVQYFTKPDGSPFQLSAADADAGMDMDQFIAMGQVKVGVPKKYTSLEFTDLTVEVPADGSESLELPLAK
ncbi:hypothetical protein GC163_01540 [bacterium]|nr:hypothetical protein [bacterium]